MDERLKLYEKMHLRYSEEFGEEDEDEEEVKDTEIKTETESLNEANLQQFRILFQIDGKNSADTVSAENIQKATEIVKSKYSGQTLTNVRSDPSFSPQPLNSSMYIRKSINSLIESIDLDSLESNDIANIIIEAMKMELDLSNYYNSAIMSLKGYNKEDVANVFQDFIKEQGCRIGKLEALFSSATNNTEEIESGREQIECDQDVDCSYFDMNNPDDDFGYSGDFKFYY